MASVMCQDPKQPKVTGPSVCLGALTPQPVAGGQAGECVLGGPRLLLCTWAQWPDIPASPRHGYLFLLHLSPAFWSNLTEH